MSMCCAAKFCQKLLKRQARGDFFYEAVAGHRSIVIERRVGADH